MYGGGAVRAPALGCVLCQPTLYVRVAQVQPGIVLICY